MGPLGVKFGIDIAEADETLADSIRDALGFGAPGDVVLPAEVVKDFTRFGPEFMSPNGELSAVLIGEAEGIEALNGKAVRLSIHDDTGLDTAVQEGLITRCSYGSGGCSITAGWCHSLSAVRAAARSHSTPLGVSRGSSASGSPVVLIDLAGDVGASFSTAVSRRSRSTTTTGDRFQRLPVTSTSWVWLLRRRPRAAAVSVPVVAVVAVCGRSGDSPSPRSRRYPSCAVRDGAILSPGQRVVLAGHFALVSDRGTWQNWPPRFSGAIMREE